MTRAIPVLLVLLSLGCHRVTIPVPPPPQVPPNAPAELRFEAGYKSGVEYLTQQMRDGSLKSDVYATFKDGSALTPLAASVFFEQKLNVDLQVTRNQAIQWLLAKVRKDGTIDEGPDGFPYPVYTAALTLKTLARPELDNTPGIAHARKAWTQYLLDRQLTGQNGWIAQDKAFGGWGYYPRLPKKPAPGEVVPAQHLLESNLSATVFALEALKAAGVNDRKVFEAARHFVETCQNEDGGFHFVYDDPVRNKAGQAGTKPDGTPRFHSYGSTTADGVRALIYAGAKRDDPKVIAARKWLEQNFRADIHPGTYIPTHEPNRNAVYFYYVASVAKALRLLEVKQINNEEWAKVLGNQILTLQTPVGSWVNAVELVRENDPAVATAYAVSALAECRKALGP